MILGVMKMDMMHREVVVLGSIEVGIVVVLYVVHMAHKVVGMVDMD